ncbi:hypothetical protein [Sanguibacter suaedae]|uniref:Uncharacterized protein n=1 Tax=Sanguibacter suaedae TaxID=2795737 RepID=A0A934MEQ1_9MICO|nr:hypothetical protein [Sanguibacter suaedae]MBI9115904.1 hypothetical protein [Sanguibacter suaedae]
MRLRLPSVWPVALVAILVTGIAGGAFEGWSWVPPLGLILVGLAAAFVPEPRRRRRTRSGRRARARTRRAARAARR